MTTRGPRCDRRGSAASPRSRPSNRPHVVPFVFALVELDLDHVVYWAVDHKPKRSSDLQRIRNLQTNPAVEFVVDAYDDDWEPVVVGPVFGIRQRGR